MEGHKNDELNIFTPNVVVFVRNTGPCRCSRSTYVLNQTNCILLK